MTQFLRDQASDSEEVVTPLMLDGTYLSRNFATLGPLIGQPPCVWKEPAVLWSFFSYPPHISELILVLSLGGLPVRSAVVLRFILFMAAINKKNKEKCCH